MKDSSSLAYNFEKLQEKVGAANSLSSHTYDRSVISSFKTRTLEKFHLLNGMNPEEVEDVVRNYIQAIIEAYALDAEILELAITGSRARGIEKPDSDLDIVVELNSEEREDVLFNAFNGYDLQIAGVKVDINPITRQHTGALEQYLRDVEQYLEEKARSMRRTAEETLPMGYYKPYLDDENNNMQHFHRGR